MYFLCISSKTKKTEHTRCHMNVIVVPCLHDNYSYILFDDIRNEAVVVDPSEALPVLRELEKNQLSLTAVLCTHHHPDRS